RPEAETVAKEELPVVQVTVRPVTVLPSESLGVAVSCSVAATATSAGFGVTVTEAIAAELEWVAFAGSPPHPTAPRERRYRHAPEGEARPAGEERNTADRREIGQGFHAGECEPVETSREEHDSRHEEPRGGPEQRVGPPGEEAADDQERERVIHVVARPGFEG